MLAPEALDQAFGRVADGDRTAFGPVFEALYPRVRAACLRITENASDADDAAQSAMMKLFESAHRYQPGRSVIGWALALALWEARSVATSNRRRSGRMGDVTALDTHPDGQPAADDQLAEREQIALLESAIADLSPAQQAAVADTLRGYVPGDATAAATLRKQRQRAVEQLRGWFRNRLTSSPTRTP